MNPKRLLLAALLLAGLPLLAWTLPDRTVPDRTALDRTALDRTVPAPSAVAARYGLTYGALEARALDELDFGPDGLLLAGDALGGTLYAIDVADEGVDTSTAAFEIADIETQLAARLGTTPDEMVLYDMAVHPTSQRVYFSVARGAEGTPVLLRVSRSGEIESVPLDAVHHARTALPGVADPEAKTRWGAPVRAYSITDLAYYDGQVFVAGLSNEEFASTLRRVPFPFASEAALTSVEIYHAAHGRYETHAPIEAFLPFELEGVPHLIAGYGCTPLATFPIADLKPGAHLRGKTVGELGGGNRPLDIVAFEREGRPTILIANSNRTLMRLETADIAQASTLTEPVTRIFETAGVPYVSVAQVGILHIDNLNPNFVAALQRNLYTGKMDLISLPARWL